MTSSRVRELKGTRRVFQNFVFLTVKRDSPKSTSPILSPHTSHALSPQSCPGLAKKKVTPHAIRHTTGVHLVEAGVDINTIREWLGHEHISTTEIYARANLRTKRLALAKLQKLDRKLLEEIAANRGVPEVDPGIRRWLDSLAD